MPFSHKMGGTNLSPYLFNRLYFLNQFHVYRKMSVKYRVPVYSLPQFPL